MDTPVESERSGDVSDAAIAFTDKAQRQRAEEAQARLAAIVNLSHDAIISKTLDGIITSWNPGAEKVFGYLAAEAIGKPMLMLFPPERVNEEKEILSRIERGERVEHFETERLRKDGKRIHVSVTISPITDSTGKIISASKIARDITERKQVADKLAASESRYRRLFETAKDGILILDAASGCVVDVNPFLSELLGYSHTVFLGKQLWEIGAFKDIVASKEAFLELQARDYIRYEDLPLETVDGRKIAVEFISSVYRVDGAKVIQCSIRDITSRKEAEAKLQKSNRELSDYVENANVCLHWVGPDGIILWANRTEMEFLGYAKDEYIGQPISKFHADPTVIDDILQRLTRCERLDSYEARLRAKDGSIKLVSINSSAYVEGEKFTHTRCFTTDITERKEAEAKVREGEENFRTMANSMSQLAWIAKPDGFIFWYNDRWYDYTGTTPEQMEGWGWQSVHDPEVLPRVLEQWTVAIAAGQMFEMEFPLRGADGIFRLFLTRALPLKDATGKVVQWFGTNTDVDELKRAESTLRKSEERLRLVLDGLGPHMFVGLMDLRGILLLANRPALEAAALRVEDVLGKPFEETYWWAYSEAVQRRLRASINRAAQGEPVRYDAQVRAAEGQLIWIDFSVYPLRDETGQITFLVPSANVINERKQTEEALRESQRQFRDRTESLPQLVWTCMPDGRCDYLSPQWVAYTGIPEQSQLGYGWAEQLHPDDRAHGTGAWMEAVRTGGNLDVEFRVRRADGVYRRFKTRAVPMRNSTGQIVKWFGTNTDVEELKSAQDEIRRLNIGLEQRVVERTAQLQAANKELEAFSYSVSHDLRAPLRGVDSFSRMVLEDYGPKLDGEGRRLLNVVCGEARRMGQLIDDLLAFARMGRQEMKTTTFDIAAMARTVFGSLNTPTRERVKTFEVKPLPPAHGDRSMMQQVLVNLLANAVKFSAGQPAPAIEIGGSTVDGFNTYYVKDNGAGFDPRFTHKLFGVFQRLHSEDEFPGTGVGLALVQRIILRHGGKVWAEGNLNAGATFYFTLPTRIET